MAERTVLVRVTLDPIHGGDEPVAAVAERAAARVRGLVLRPARPLLGASLWRVSGATALPDGVRVVEPAEVLPAARRSVAALCERYGRDGDYEAGSDAADAIERLEAAMTDVEIAVNTARLVGGAP